MSHSVEVLASAPSMLELLTEIRHAARSDAKVIITGESGSGKELAARQIHEHSGRSNMPIVAINCAGIPEELLESELFGHTRGSFTGAYRDKAGLLELAHRGTVFLDEVGEMSLRMQGLLLRFMDSGEIQRIGSGHTDNRVDVRIIAATNRNLFQAVTNKMFREDLYYRLNVIHLSVPPLRDRACDIPLLLNHFLQKFSDQYGVARPVIAPDALSRLVGYPWPGNIRELKNLVERMVVTLRTSGLSVADLPIEIRSWSPAPPEAVPAPPARPVAEQILEKLVQEKQSFWSVVYTPFMLRDLTRDDLRQIVRMGLERTSGSYKVLTELFNMESDDYRRFLNFLRKHQCHMPFQSYRCVTEREGEPSGKHVSRRHWRATA